MQHNGLTNHNGRSERVRHFFTHFAAHASWALGTVWAFSLACLLIITWLALGPRFHYSNAWQLVVNTATTVITFLMVFLIQHTQNRDARALHLKMDEIIRAVHAAHNDMIDIEKMDDDELEERARRYERIREHVEKHVEALREKRGRKPVDNSKLRIQNSK